MTPSIISRTYEFYESIIQKDAIKEENLFQKLDDNLLDDKILVDNLLTSKINNTFIEKFLTPLLESIIAGEYLTDSEYYEKLKIVKEKNEEIIYANNINSSDRIEDPVDFEKIDNVNDFKIKIYQIIDTVIKELEDFYNYLLNYKITDLNPQFLYKKEFNIQNLENYNDDLINPIKVLLIAMEVAYIEYLQIFNIESYSKLIHYLSDINEIIIGDNNDLIELLKAKIELICYSIKPNYKDISAFKLLESQKELTDSQLTNNELFKGIKKKIDYYNSGNDLKYSREFTLTEDNKCEKIYCKIFEANKKEQNLNELNELLSNKPFKKNDSKGTEENLNSKYNRSIPTINKLYLENCILSLKVNTKKFSSSIDDDVSYINSNQANYYQITRKIDYLKEWFNNNSIPVPDYENKKEDLKKNYIPKLNQLRLSQITNSTVPFKLPIDECIHNVNFNNTSYKILLLNTFIKYYSPEHTKEKIENGIFTAYELINRIEAFKTNEEARKLVADTKQVVADTKKDIKNSERRSIEIISIFAAIVIFAAGAINIVPRIENVEILVPAMLLFGFVLICFIGLLLLFIEPERFKQKLFYIPELYKWILILGVAFNLTFLIIISLKLNISEFCKNFLLILCIFK